MAIGGSVVAAAVPSFLENLHASRLTEPMDGLARIAVRATALAASRPARIAYPDTVGLTPAQVPKGELATDPEGTWDHSTWRLLSFRFDAPHAYSFAFESRLSEGRAVFFARAHGDLDGDGNLSTFSVSGESRDGAEPRVFPVEIQRDVE